MKLTESEDVPNLIHRIKIRITSDINSYSIGYKSKCLFFEWQLSKTPPCSALQPHSFVCEWPPEPQSIQKEQSVSINYMTVSSSDWCEQWRFASVSVTFSRWTSKVQYFGKAGVNNWLSKSCPDFPATGERWHSVKMIEILHCRTLYKIFQEIIFS